MTRWQGPRAPNQRWLYKTQFTVGINLALVRLVSGCDRKRSATLGVVARPGKRLDFGAY